MNFRAISRCAIALGAAIFLFVASGRSGAADPIPLRGDVNDDGVVTPSDAYMLFVYQFRGGQAPRCLNLADANFDDKVDIADMAAILTNLFGVGDWRFQFPPVDPCYAWVDTDGDGIPDDYLPTDDYSCVCEDYGGGSPLPDPQAGLRLLDAVAPGGESCLASITVAVTNSWDIGGISGTVRLPEGLGHESNKSRIISNPTSEYFYQLASMEGDVIKFGCLFWKQYPIVFEPLAPGTDVEVIRISFNLATGTPAGTYPIVLEAGELIDDASSRAIQPILAGCTLTVQEEVRGSPTPPPPPPPPPTTLSKAVYTIGSGTAVPGGEVVVPFFILADAPIQGYELDLEFDETVLTMDRIEEVWQRPDGEEIEMKQYLFNNRDPQAGDLGVILCRAIFSLSSDVTMPADTEIEALRLHFTVDPGTTAASTTIGFASGFRIGNVPPETVHNGLSVEGHSVYPEMIESFLFINGRITIKDDVAVFVRGDSNGDLELDISDPVYLLSFLFTGGPAPPCLDAADADDNGALEVTDAINVLDFLFLGGDAASAATFGKKVEDLTPDSLSCGGQ